MPDTTELDNKEEFDVAKAYTNPELWSKSKSRAKAKMGGKWSARAAQLATKYYKGSGGGYSGSKTKPQKSIDRWTSENWSASDGKPAKRKDRSGKTVTKRYLPAKAWENLTPAQKRATNAKKVAGSRKGKQFVANTEAAASAGRNARKAEVALPKKRSKIPRDHFLIPGSRKYPYKNPDGSVNIELLKAAIARASVNGETVLEAKAKEIYATHKSSGIDGGVGLIELIKDKPKIRRGLQTIIRTNAQQRLKFVSGYKSENISDGEKKRRDSLYTRFYELCNMSGKSVLKYAQSDRGKDSGLSRKEASSQGIASGRQRPAQIARLKSKSKAQWTAADYRIAARVVSFISRMKGAAGPLYDDKGRPTRKLMSLKIWGHNPVSKSESIHESVENLVFKSEAITDTKTLVVNGVDMSMYNRVIMIVPTWDAVDLQNQMVTKEALRKSIKFYEKNGNIDLEHLTRMGKTEAEAKKKILAEGFKYNEIAGRNYYEIGRPIPGTFQPEDCSFFAYIYEGMEMADWFWKTATQVSPPVPWRASVGGKMSRPIPYIIENTDEQLGIVGRKQLVGLVKEWRWNNTAMTCAPVQHWVPPITIIQDTIGRKKD